MDARAKKLMLMAAVVVLIFVGVTGYFLLSNSKKSENPALNVRDNLFPFDTKSPDVVNLPVIDSENPDSVSVNDPDATTSSKARLRKITPFPVSGMVSFIEQSFIMEKVLDEKTKLEKEVSRPIAIHKIRYNDRRNGHIFEAIITDESILNTKIIKTDLPAAEELFFDPTGRTGILRYELNNAIQSFRISIPEPPSVPRYCQNPYTTNYVVGSKGPGVTLLQEYINYKLGLTMKSDGVFGKGTSENIKKIQAGFELIQTGIADDPTREAINEECATIRSTVQEAQSQPRELQGAVAPGYITQAVPYTGNLFLLRTQDKKTFGSIESFTGSVRTDVFASSFNEWMPQYVNSNLITLTTYASGTTPGYMYALDPVKKSTSKVLGPLTGLTTLTSPDGTKTLVGVVENDQLVTKLINLSARTERKLPFVTLPEKCSWYSNDQLYCGVPTTIPRGIYPDAWYKGLTHFSDTLWGYVPSTGRTVQVATFTIPVDIIRMQSYANASYLFFMDKNTYELWSYRLGGSDE